MRVELRMTGPVNTNVGRETSEYGDDIAQGTPHPSATVGFHPIAMNEKTPYVDRPVSSTGGRTKLPA